MLRLIIRQTNWAILGSFLTFLVGFVVTTYVVREVGLEIWGRYKTAHIFASIMDVFLAVGIPYVILRFFPSLLNKDPQKASVIIRKILRYAVSISIIFLIVIFLTKDLLDIHLYPEYPNFSYLLFFISVHAPISIFMGIITSLYRSVLKIKEIMIYGTFIAVPLRGVITFIVFQYTSDIFCLVAIDIFVQLLTLFLLYYFFNKREFKIFNNKLSNHNTSIDNSIFSYGKKMYATSIIYLLSAKGLPLLIGFLLIADQMGMYAILMTITGLSMFLNKSLRKIFSPAISKLYEENKIKELNILYKQTTFIVNVLTIPFSILIIFFSDEIFQLYNMNSDQILYCKPLLFILIIARLSSLLAGNSGAIMAMAGIERKEFIIQSIRSILSIIFALFFIQEYELQAIVIILMSSIVFESISQLFFINHSIKISPFSSDLIYLILLSIPLVYFSIVQNLDIGFYHYILLPIIIYLFYFVVFYKRLRKIYLEIK